MNSESVSKALRKFSDKKKSGILKSFFKTGPGEYGEGDIFLGVSVPDCRAVAKKHPNLSFFELKKILNSKFHEERLTALLILVHQFKKGNEEEKKKITRFYLQNTKQINNWDLVDLSAYHIVGAFLEKKEKTILLNLSKSKNLWERRIAIVSTFHEIRLGKPEIAFFISEKLLRDPHDLIHKACGWMLREAGKRCSEVKLEKFLMKHALKMPRTMLRYAIEKFPENKRKFYLNLGK